MLLDGHKRASNPELEFLRNRTVVIIGCSLDRYFLEFFCFSNAGKFSNPVGDWRGVFTCDIAELDFQVQLWFTYGAVSEHGDVPDVYDGLGLGMKNYEDRIKTFLKPAVAESGLPTMPDMIIFASGTWDVLGLRKRYSVESDGYKDQAVSYKELAWHRHRLTQIADVIRTEWPGVPVMYRPPTYLFKMDIKWTNYFMHGLTIPDLDYVNEGVYRIGQSAEALMAMLNIPVFRWAEKLVGHNMYGDPVHFGSTSFANFLYGDMLLYYLKSFTVGSDWGCR